MNDRELMQQALAALCQSSDPKHGYRRNELFLQPKFHIELYQEAIEALRARLEQPEMFNGLTEEQTNATMSVMGLAQRDGMAKFEFQEYGPPNWGKSQAAQPEPEPVAWMEFERFMDEDGLMSERKVLYTWDPCRGVPLYTAPPQREWVGLTEDDLNFWGDELGLGELGKGVLRAVEDHLKKENK